MNYENIKDALLAFLRTCLKQTKCKNFIIGLSGGLDSAIVLTLCSYIKEVKTYAILMPNQASNEQNLKDALALCEKLNIEYKIINIENILDSFKNTLDEELDFTRQGNLSARIRMSILYDQSAKLNACVVGTSNLSERMLGYFTIFGDSAYAFNPIGELFKSDLFAFAKFLKIDENIISKAPSADLYEGQSDESEFGFTYKQIDEVLKQIYIKNSSKDELKGKFDENLLTFIFDRINKNSFKLKEAKIAKINY